MGAVQRPTPQGRLSDDDSELLRNCLGALRAAIDRGHVPTVARLLRESAEVPRLAALETSVLPALEDARRWLAEAEAYEAVNGPGSKLDQSHGLNIAIREAITEYRNRRRRTTERPAA